MKSGTPGQPDPSAAAQAEAVLAASDQLLAAIVQSVTDAIISIDARQRIVLFNPAAEKMFGCTALEALGSHFERFIPERFRAAHRVDVGMFAQNGVGTRPMAERRELFGLRANGEEFPLEASISKAGTGSDMMLTVVLRDISERKRAESALRQSEERLRAALRAGRLGVHDYDPRTRQAKWDARMCELWGLPEDAPVTYEVFERGVHPEDRRQVRAILARALDPRGSHRYEADYRIINHENGAIRWVHADGDVSFEGGTATRLVGTVQDVTALKQAEAALRESEERLRLFIEHVPAAVAMFDCDMRYIAVSRRWLTDYGLKEPVLGRSHYDAFPHVPERWKEVYRLALAGQVMTGELDPFEPTDGSVRWLRWEARPWHRADGAIGGIVVFERDMSPRKRMEDALRESEEQLRTILDSSPAFIFVKDLDGRYQFVNRAFELFFGVSRAEIEGKTDSELFPEAVAEVLRANDATVLAEGRQEFEEVVPHLDGPHTNLSVKVPLIGASGKPIAVCGIATDITARKAMEEALIEAGQRKDEFIAMLAHELRNPLVPIRNMAAVVRRRGPLDPGLAKACAAVDRQVDHLVRIIDDLLDVSRIERGRLTLRKERCDLAQVLREAAGDFRPQFEERHLSLTLSVPASPVWIEGDRVRLAQLAGNLLHNAQKFTPAGGTVTVTLSASAGEAFLAVRDTGIGIAPGLLAHLFEPFEQAPQGPDRSEGGLGLGLSLVRSIAVLHGGDATAESAGEGQGATFTVRLPLAAPTMPADGSAQAGQQASAARRVLLVEDDWLVADSTRQLIESMGHHVRLATDGQKALAAVRSFLPEVVLCDIGLPGGMDGFAVARSIKSDTELAKPYLVALSGYGNKETVEQARAAGFDQHITKPIAAAVLEQLLATFAHR